ncbi:MAG: hypothetical protein H0V89_09190 [Deltaproteobacteria bacterium]|nr:hypothetical protein [Deltaproteobacteria bacterium]
MTSETTKPRTLTSSVDEVVRWRAAEEARLEGEIVEIDREITGIRAAMANLEERLALKTGSRTELDGQAGAIGRVATERTYQVVFETLAQQAAALSDRAGLVATAEFARAAKIEASVKASAGKLLEQYRQFKTTVEPTLAALPETYRDVLTAHHQDLTVKIRAMIDAATPPVEPLQAEIIELDVVWAIDAHDGKPDLLVVVVPADEDVTTAWADRGDDTELSLAARVVQGLTESLAAAGLPSARPALGGHLGLLAIEVDLTGAGADFATVLGTSLARVLSAAPELGEAGLKAVARQVEMDWLLPPEEAEGSVA